MGPSMAAAADCFLSFFRRGNNRDMGDIEDLVCFVELNGTKSVENTKIHSVCTLLSGMEKGLKNPHEIRYCGLPNIQW